jgi:pilus assembly protein CpaE
METSSASRTTGNAAYRVVAVEPEQRVRTKLVIEHASLGIQPFETIDAMLDATERTDAVVCVLGPSLANDTGLAAASRLARSNPEIGTLLLADELSLPLLQQALRSGVRDAVTLDGSEGQLRQAIERVAETVMAISNRAAAAATQSATLGRVIVSFSTKGGVGKSVISTNVSTALAAAGKRVVIVDADLQFGDVAVLLGVPPHHTTVEAAGAIRSADEHLMDSLLATHGSTGLRVLPAPIEPSAADHISPEEMLGIVRLLRTMFDFIVIDMPPHFDDVVLALLDEADDVLLVCSMDIPSIKNLKVGIQTLNLLQLAGDKLKLVLNRANAKVNLDIADVERAIGVPAQYRIPSDIAVPQAVNRGTPVVIDKPKSAAGLALQQLASSFLGAPVAMETNEAGETILSTAPTSDTRRRWRRSE